jgi:hypothetical protein
MSTWRRLGEPLTPKVRMLWVAVAVIVVAWLVLLLVGAITT